MNKVEAYGYMEAGRLKILNDRRFKAELAALRDMDVHITIKKKGKRSNQSLRYYWGVVIEEIRIELKRRGTIADPETIHAYLKQKFNPQRIVIEATGEVIEMGGSTTDFNQEEMGEYLEKIIQWCAESLEIHISPPNTQTSMFNLTAA
jgi:hypothetical protein